MKIKKMFKKSLLTLLIIIFTSLISSCITQEGVKQSKKISLSVQVGSNKGGITENTDIVNTNNVSPDAFSGATNTQKSGVNAGLHFLFPLKRNKIETSIDIMLNQQRFRYSDLLNLYSGERNIEITQIMLPLTYNFDIFRNKSNQGLLQIKLGGILQYNYLDVSNKGILPEYEYNRLSGGFTLGFRLLPFKFKNDRILGLYVDAYRGTQIYKDFYNKSSFEMPGSSFSKVGVFFQF